MLKEKQVMIELSNELSEQIRAVIIETREHTTLLAVDMGNVEFEIVEITNNSFSVVGEV
ncbi:hypothetical protein RJG79_01780 [Mycoplasmatota bacterium WC44]